MVRLFVLQFDSSFCFSCFLLLFCFMRVKRNSVCPKDVMVPCWCTSKNL